MVVASAELVINCRPQEFVDFVLDQRRYAYIDDKIKSVSYVETFEDVTEVRYRPRPARGSYSWPKVTLLMQRVSEGQVDVALAPFPRNVIHHLMGRYRARFVCETIDDKTLVRREVCYQPRALLRWLVEPQVRRGLQPSLRRELLGARAVLESRSRRDAHVIIVGAGLSGIAAAVKLREAGISDLLILEKSQRCGGAWFKNTYPGCAVDIPSALYSFSFEPNPHWTRVFAGQAEILDYIERTLTKYGLVDLLKMGTELLNARWVSEQQRWMLTTSDGQFGAQHVIFATGMLDHPHVPDIAGLEHFPGHAFHSARWNHGVDLSDKRIAVIGSGSSAVQIVPQLQPLARKLYVFQRTPAWVIPRPDLTIPEPIRRVFTTYPWLLRVVRWVFAEILGVAAFAMRDARRAQAITPLARWLVGKQVRRVGLSSRVIPDYTLGCKRLVMSNDYYSALGASNVELLPHALTEVRGQAAVAADGSQRDVDVIVFGSGFELRHPPIAERIRGRDGRLLSESWDAGSPRAYRCTTVPNIPNAYFLLGPNIVMYNSLLALAEWQISYIIGAIRTAEDEGGAALEVRSEAFMEFNRRLANDILSSAYNQGGCASYYLDEKNRNFVTFPWSARTLRRSLQRFDRRNYWTPQTGVGRASRS